jgi:sugar lactone lactonase YvrE
VTAVTRWRDVDVVIDMHARLGEGPLWDHRKSLLAWVDILAGLVHFTDPDTGVTTSIPAGTAVGALALRGDDGHLLAVRNGFATLDGTSIEITNEVLRVGGQRMNDGALDPAGRFVAGSITDDRSATGALYTRETDGSVRQLFDGVTVSNGLAWSASGGRMFYVDSPLQSIDVMDYDIESGTVSGRETFAAIPNSAGIPDGLTIDAEGCLWLALWGGSAVRRYSPEGTLIGEVELPVPRVTSCAFGGPDLDRLFITTASVGASPDDPPRPLEGALFVVDPGCTGVESVVADMPA